MGSCVCLGLSFPNCSEERGPLESSLPSRPGSAVPVSVLQACTCPLAPHSSQLPRPRREPHSHLTGRSQGPERAPTPQVTQPVGEGGVGASGTWGSLYFLGLRGTTQPAHLQTVLTAVACTRVGTHSTDVNTQILRQADTSAHTHLHTQLGLEAAVSGGSCASFLTPFRSMNTF